MKVSIKRHSHPDFSASHPRAWTISCGGWSAPSHWSGMPVRWLNPTINPANRENDIFENLSYIFSALHNSNARGLYYLHGCTIWAWRPRRWPPACQLNRTPPGSSSQPSAAIHSPVPPLSHTILFINFAESFSTSSAFQSIIFCQWYAIIY